MVYPVGDLVTAFHDQSIMRDNKAADEPAATEKTLAETLVAIITTTIAKDSWQTAGGQGSIQYVPRDMALVVSQTSGVQEEVHDLLKDMRRAEELQISFVFRLLEVPGATAERIQKTMDKDGTSDSLGRDVPCARRKHVGLVRR